MHRRIEFAPAYDKRHPDPQKNYGIHGVEMRWLLEGPRGVIQFLVYTNQSRSGRLLPDTRQGRTRGRVAEDGGVLPKDLWGTKQRSANARREHTMRNARKSNWRELTEPYRPVSKHKSYTRNQAAKVAKRRAARKRAKQTRRKQRQKRR